MTAREVVPAERIAEGAVLVRRLRARAVVLAHLNWAARDEARRKRVDALPTPIVPKTPTRGGAQWTTTASQR